MLCLGALSGRESASMATLFDMTYLLVYRILCVAKKEKSKRVPELGGRELTDLSPDVLTAYTMAGP